MSHYQDQELMHASVEIVRDIQSFVKQELEVNRSRGLGPIFVGESKKKAIALDRAAEDRAEAAFNGKFQDYGGICFVGEETLGEGNIDFTLENRPCVLVDMIDGTDLVEIGNSSWWCSAIVIFQPHPIHPEIIGSVVGLGTGEIYKAWRNDKDPETKKTRAWVCRDSNKDAKAELGWATVPGASGVEELRDAVICFYGQKAGSLLSVVRHSRFLDSLEQIQNDPNSTFRSHTLAGNPAMVKLVDRERDAVEKTNKPVGRGIDAVFDISGQQLHDLVPGAYIAQKAGACLLGIDGEEIQESTLARNLMKPSGTMQYFLASTKPLATELHHLFVNSFEQNGKGKKTDKKMNAPKDRRNRGSRDGNAPGMVGSKNSKTSRRSKKSKARIQTNPRPR